MKDIEALKIEGSDFANALITNANETEKREMFLVMTGFQLAKTIKTVSKETIKADQEAM